MAPLRFVRRSSAPRTSAPRLHAAPAALAATLLLACAQGGGVSARGDSAAAAAPAESASASAETDTTGVWRSLFDGRTLAGWHAYKGGGAPTGWAVENGELTRAGAGGDIVTDDEFGNFELALEWKVAPAGNSGIFYRVIDGEQETYHSGPEMQVLDDAAHPDGKSRLTSAGAAYGLYPAPTGAVRPAGEWNQVRLVVNGAHVEHWLNGVKTADYELWSPDWEKRVRESKFVEWPKYGRATRGRIALQDHGDRVAFRNVRIRELP